MLPRTASLLLVAVALLLAPVTGQAQDKDGWISLFNGKNLDGWKIGDAKQGKWKVENGSIVANGPRSHLFTIREFKNFEFKAEVMTTPGSNSYSRTSCMPSSKPSRCLPMSPCTDMPDTTDPDSSPLRQDPE